MPKVITRKPRKLPKKMCYLTPDYPEHGWILGYFMVFNGGHLVFNAMSRIFPSLKSAGEELSRVFKNLAKKNPEIMLVDDCVLHYISKKELIPLSPDYWLNPTVSMGVDDKIKMINEVFQNPVFYEYLVTPLFENKKKMTWKFYRAFSVKVGTPKVDIENLFKNSDFPVEEAASHAAVYSINRCYKYNLKTHELHESNVMTMPMEGVN